MPQSDFYRCGEHIPLAGRLSRESRLIIFNCFMKIMAPGPESRVLDVGVTSESSSEEANMLEQRFPFKQNLICAGIEDAAHLETAYPGIKFVRLEPHQVLPFADKQFDIVHSHAVLEHVGNADDQRTFLSELCRVAKNVFVSVPNRLFPVEHHTAIPFLHYLPQIFFRSILRTIGNDFYSKEENLNLMYPWKLSGLFPTEYKPTIVFAGVGFGVFKSNVIAWIKGEER
ncbi:MAG: methyltransferase domain-containing protein [Deltaproteobacteria bacterium]|nr:methyltransferase domain-containing protein [Deltaproteobacteria bacterium]